MKIKYRHTNIIARDWKALCNFYKTVFDCVEAPPRRKQSGQWLEDGTNTPGAALEGMHLFLPGFEDCLNKPTLEIFSYKAMKDRSPTASNRIGFGHIAFEVENVSTLLENVVKHGGKRYGKIVTQKIPGAGTLKFTYALDLEDNIIELQSWS